MNKKVICLCVVGASLLLCMGVFVCRVGGRVIDEEIKNYIQKNPEVIIDVLSVDCEKLYQISQRGENQIYENGLREAWRVDVRNNDRLEKISFAGSPIKGNRNSTVKIVVYSDFFCRYCRELAPDLEKLSTEYDIGYVYKTLPLDQIPNTDLAAQYFVGAFSISPEKAWKVHDDFFQNPQRIVKDGDKYFVEVLRKYGFNMNATLAAIRSNRVKELVERNVKEADVLGIQFRPCIIIGNLMIPGKIRYELLCEAVEMALSQTETTN